MKLDTDQNGNLTIHADGQDSPIVAGVPQGIILVLRDGRVLELWETDGRIERRETRASAPSLV